MDVAGPKMKVNIDENNYIDYYIKRKDYKMPENKVKSVYEFHGNCYSTLDTTNWAASSKYSC